MEFSRYGTLDANGRLQPPKPEPKAEKKRDRPSRGIVRTLVELLVLALLAAGAFLYWRSPRQFRSVGEDLRRTLRGVAENPTSMPVQKGRLKVGVSTAPTADSPAKIEIKP